MSKEPGAVQPPIVVTPGTAVDKMGRMIPVLPKLGDVLFAFPTPILLRQWPDSGALNPQLRDLVLAKEQAESGVSRSNAGGWHSDDQLFNWDHPAIGELKRRVHEATREITLKTCGQVARDWIAEVDMEMEAGRANVSRDRAYNRIHKHPECTWSGVYYVSLGDGDTSVKDNGSIEFVDPRMAVDSGPLPGQPFGGQIRLAPEPGMMLVFPNWLLHWVHPFQGGGERISLAFNVTLKPRPKT